jgi:biopolymer transport protein ExbD
MAMSGGRDDGQPMMEMNTTPLIDVMLVLLIMFIISLPPPTHAVKIDLPSPCEPNCPPPPEVLPQKNVLYIAPNSQITWNNVPINWATLNNNLKDSVDTSKFENLPELHFQPDQFAPYDTVDKVLALIKANKVTKMGFIGNEAYRTAF